MVGVERRFSACNQIASGGLLDRRIAGSWGWRGPFGRPGPAVWDFGGLAGVPMAARSRRNKSDPTVVAPCHQGSTHVRYVGDPA